MDIKKRWFWVFLITFLLISLTNVIVLAAPPIPYRPQGSVLLNGDNVPDGTAITGFCGGVQYGYSESFTVSGISKYKMNVLGDDPSTPDAKEGCYPGETVTFKIDTVTADQEAIWSSGSAALDLTATKLYPDIAIEKYINGQEADDLPGPYLSTGSGLTWSYLVTNSGETPLTGIVVTDDNGTPGDSEDDFDVCGPFDLAVGADYICYHYSTVQPGAYVNIATATGNTPEDPPVFKSDAAHYFGAAPAANLVKLTNLEDANTTPGVIVEQGDEVVWNYEVTNSGNVDLTNVIVIDNNGTEGDTSDDITICTIPLLTAGSTDTTSCQLSSTAVVGQYRNIAVVTGTPPGGLDNVSDDDPSHYFGSAPGITIIKKTNGTQYTVAPGSYILVDDPITWTYELENTGNVPLSNVTVVDDPGSPTDPDDDITVCTGITLEPGGTHTCSLEGTASEGQYHNTATVTGAPPVGSDVLTSDNSYYFGADPAVEVEFLINDVPADTGPGLYVLSGTDVTLKYAVYNAGNVPLTSLVVTDSLGHSCNIPSLDIGITDDSTCTRTITAGSGEQSLYASVTAAPPGGLENISSGQDNIYYFGAVPALSLDKQTNGQDPIESPGVYVETGSTVNWTYDLSNDGNVKLENVRVVDDNGTPLDLTDDWEVCSGITLYPSGDPLGNSTHTCHWSKTAIEGQYTNNAAAYGDPPLPLSETTAADTSYYFGATLLVSLDKRTNGQTADSAPGPYVAFGDPVSWTYTITNNSNVGVSFVISDNPTAVITCDKYALNARVGEEIDSVICTAQGTAAAGQYANTATVTITPPGGLLPYDIQDTSHYFGVTTGIDIQKKTNGQDADDPTGPLIKVGTSINWTYEVTNLSNIPINTIVVTDSDDALEVTCLSSELAPGISMTCTASGEAVAGQYSNVGSVSAATSPDGFGPLNDSDPSHYFGSDAGVEINKLINDIDIDFDPVPYILVGDPVYWKYIVTNVGNLQINDIVVTDSDAELVITCPGTTLEPGISMTCTAEDEASAGEYTNTGYVEATPAGFAEPVQNSDDSAYIGAAPSITIEKFTNGVDADTAPGPYIPVGEQLSFQYEVSSDETLYRFTEISVSDDTGVTVTCESSTFEPGDDPINCTAEEVAELGQQSYSGHVTAKAVLIAYDEALGFVGDSDSSHYFGYTLGLDLIKMTNGQIVEAPPGPALAIGKTVTWTYQLTNSSNVSLSNIAVIDNQEPVINCPLSNMAPAAIMICSATGTVEEGPYTNTAQAAGEFVEKAETILSSQVSSHYLGVPGFDLFLPFIMR